MNLEERLASVFSQVFEASPEELNDYTSPETLSRWDSMGTILLAMALEEEFHIQFKSDELTQLTDLRRIREILMNKGIV